MPYPAEFTATAVNDFSRLDPSIAQRVRSAINRLAENAESIRHRSLAGPYRSQFRLRVGDYRVLYQIDRANGVVTVLRVGRRNEVYRNG